MSLRFLQNFNKDLEVIYAKYSNSSEDGPELLLSACDERENRKLINSYSFSSCKDWQVLPDSELDCSLTDSSCNSSDEKSGLLSYYKDEVSGDVYTTPVHSCGEESGFSNSDDWESDSSGPIRSYKTVKNKPRSCDKYDRPEKPSPISSLFVDASQCNVFSARSGFSDNKALVSSHNLDLSGDDNLYMHTRKRKYLRKNKNFSKLTSSDNRIDLFNAKCSPKKHPNIVGHSDLLTAVHKFHNLFTNHFRRSETRCNHLPEFSMVSKALDKCCDEKNLGNLEVNRQEFCNESGKKQRFLKAKKSTAVQPGYIVEKLFVRPKGSPGHSFVEIASCESFNTKTKIGHRQLQSSPFKCLETLSTTNMQRSLDAISGWTKPLLKSPISDTKCCRALDPKNSLTPVSSDRVRFPVLKAPSVTHSCPPQRCFQVSSADGNQDRSLSAVSSLTHALDEILSTNNTFNTRQHSHTLTSQSSSVNKSESSRKLQPQAKYSGVKSPGVNSSGVNSSGVKSPVVKSPDVKSSGVKSPGVKSSGVKSSGVKSSGVKSSGIKNSGVKSPGVKISLGVNNDRLKSPHSITSQKPGYHKGLKSPVINTNSCGSNQPSVPLKATPRSNSLRLSDISLELCQTLTPGEQTSSSFKRQKRVPRFGESTPCPINSPTKNSTHAHDKLSGQQYKKRWCKRPNYYHENGASQSCLYDNNECLLDYTLNVLRSDGTQTKATAPPDIKKHDPRQSKPETPQAKVIGNHFNRFTSPVSSNDDSPRVKNSLKVKNTRRRNSLGFHPYGYSNRKQSPSLSSPLQAIVSPSCDETLRWSTSGHKPKPRRSVESEIKSRKSSDSQKKLAFDAFEKHAASDNSDVMQDCCPDNCTKKFCFNCAMDCS